MYRQGNAWMKNIKRVLFVFMFSFLLIGCGDSAEDTYNASVESGLEYLAADDFEGAKSSFNEALEAMPEDEYAKATLLQIESYQQALSDFENEASEDALKSAQEVTALTNGADELNGKARDLIAKVQKDLDEKEAAEQARIEAEEKERIAQEEKEAAEKAEAERIAAEKEAAEKAAVEVASSQSVTYEDFKGIYGLYEGEPFNSKLVMIYILNDEHLTEIVTDWMEYMVSDIANIAIEDNVLYLDYLGVDEGPTTYEDGSYVMKLKYAEDGHKTLMINDSPLYEMTRGQLDSYGYSLDEYLFNGL